MPRRKQETLSTSRIEREREKSECTLKGRKGKKRCATLFGSFGCQYRKLEIRSRRGVPVRSQRVRVPSTWTRAPPSAPTIARGRAPKTLRDRTVTVGALAAHKSNNIDHVFTLPSLRSHHYYVTAQRYIQRRVHVCARVRAGRCRSVVAVGTISGKIRGKYTIYRVTCARLCVCLREQPRAPSGAIYRRAAAAANATPN